ncbi:hypothetical protein L6R50_27190 [Myxococcota bacterium]|nr:hypothetical protein [Myxococcota bacterium]
MRERWEAVKGRLTPEELRLALQVERLMGEFDPPAFSLSPTHFVQTVVATARRVEVPHERRVRLAQVTRREVLGGRPEF